MRNISRQDLEYAWWGVASFWSGITAICGWLLVAPILSHFVEPSSVGLSGPIGCVAIFIAYFSLRKFIYAEEELKAFNRNETVAEHNEITLSSAADKFLALILMSPWIVPLGVIGFPYWIYRYVRGRGGVK